MIAELIASLYDVSFLVNGLILLSVLLLFPQGAIGLVQKVAGLFRRRGARQDTGDLPKRGPSAHLPLAAAPRLRPVLRSSSRTCPSRYGGVVAVSDVSLSRRPRHGACSHRPERSGQVDAHQLRQRSLSLPIPAASCWPARTYPTCRRMRGPAWGLRAPSRTFSSSTA